MSAFLNFYAGSKNPNDFASPVDVTHATVRSFTYIIAGGGTAGCVLASRVHTSGTTTPFFSPLADRRGVKQLSEDPSVSVLLIEAGERDQKQIMSRIPSGWGNLWKSTAEWGFETVPQKTLDGRVMYQPRGKMLGGCSSINAQIHQHCSPSDYNDWEVKGANGWNWESMRPYFLKQELHAPNPDDGVNLSANRGSDGIWKTSCLPANEISRAFVKAGINLGIPSSKDFNSDTDTLGIARFATHIDSKGVRSSTSSAYLSKPVYKRPNLSILLSTTVTSLLFDKNDVTRVVGVQMGQKKDGPRWIAHAEKEVILSLGAFGSPALLLASGIGPKLDLENLGICAVKNLPVGENLKDHLLTTVTWEVKKGTSLQYLTNPISTLPYLARWLFNGTGPLSTNLAECGAFLRSDELPDGQASSIPEGATNASGPTSPDLELINAPLYYVHHALEKPPKPNGDYFTLAAVPLRPLSKGKLSIASKSTFDPPLIAPNYLDEELDRKVMLEGIKLIRRLGETEPLKSYIVESVSPIKLETLGDDELNRHINEASETMYHPMGTCKIGLESSGGVVSPSLRVHGIENLRVCDASIFPDSVSGHPVAAVVAVAERFADILKGVVAA